MNTSETPVTIEIQPYTPQWKESFGALTVEIWPHISNWADRIEHVGSTSVEELWAKPIIDMDIVIPDDKSLQNVIEGLGQLGYTHLGNLGIEGREAFKIADPKIPHNLYVCIEGCLAFRNHILLRDHLRANLQDREQYSLLKKQLATQFPNDIDSYIEGKTQFILSILKLYHLQSDELSSIEAVNKKSTL